MSSGRNHKRCCLEFLETKRCLSSVGWDGPGQGSAELTYYVGQAPSYLDQSAFEEAIEAALAAWSDVVDVEFTQTSRPDLRDSIDFEFKSLDGTNGTLAQAYFPDDVNSARIAGDIQFDSSETWEIGNARGRSAFDLTLVAVHEIGHSLGIDHIHRSGAVLNTSVSASQSFDKLSSDDIDAALRLYAAAATPSIESMPASDRQANQAANETTDERAAQPTDSSLSPRPRSPWRGRWGGSWIVIRWRTDRTNSSSVDSNRFTSQHDTRFVTQFNTPWGSFGFGLHGRRARLT